MKSLKTFNLDIDVIQIVKQKANQSQFVCKAVRKLHKQESEIVLSDIETRRIAMSLKNRDEVPDHIKRELINWLFESMNGGE